MDVSRDQEHDRIHLRDLLTCSATSRVSPVRGSESGGFSAPPKYQWGFGHVIHCNSEIRHSKKLRQPASSLPSTPKPSSARPTASRNAKADSP